MEDIISEREHLENNNNVSYFLEESTASCGVEPDV